MFINIIFPSDVYDAVEGYMPIPIVICMYIYIYARIIYIHIHIHIYIHIHSHHRFIHDKANPVQP